MAMILKDGPALPTLPDAAAKSATDFSRSLLTGTANTDAFSLSNLGSGLDRGALQTGLSLTNNPGSLLDSSLTFTSATHPISIAGAYSPWSPLDAVALSASPMKVEPLVKAPEVTQKVTTPEDVRILVNAAADRDEAKVKLQKLYDETPEKDRPALKTTIDSGITLAKGDKVNEFGTDGWRKVSFIGAYDLKETPPPAAPVAKPEIGVGEGVASDPSVVRHVPTPSTWTSIKEGVASAIVSADNAMFGGPNPAIASTSIANASIASTMTNLDISTSKAARDVNKLIADSGYAHREQVRADFLQGIAGLDGLIKANEKYPDTQAELQLRLNVMLKVGKEHGFIGSGVQVEAPAAKVAPVTVAPVVAAVSSAVPAAPQAVAPAQTPAPEATTKLSPEQLSAQVQQQVERLVLDSRMNPKNGELSAVDALRQIEAIYNNGDQEIKAAVFMAYTNAVTNQLPRELERELARPEAPHLPHTGKELNARMTYFLQQAGKADGLNFTMIDPRTQEAAPKPEKISADFNELLRTNKGGFPWDADKNTPKITAAINDYLAKGQIDEVRQAAIAIFSDPKNANTYYPSRMIEAINASNIPQDQRERLLADIAGASTAKLLNDTLARGGRLELGQYNSDMGYGGETATHLQMIRKAMNGSPGSDAAISAAISSTAGELYAKGKDDRFARSNADELIASVERGRLKDFGPFSSVTVAQVKKQEREQLELQQQAELQKKQDLDRGAQANREFALRRIAGIVADQKLSDDEKFKAIRSIQDGAKAGGFEISKADRNAAIRDALTAYVSESPAFDKRTEATVDSFRSQYDLSRGDRRQILLGAVEQRVNGALARGGSDDVQLAQNELNYMLKNWSGWDSEATNQPRIAKMQNSLALARQDTARETFIAAVSNPNITREERRLAIQQAKRDGLSEEDLVAAAVEARPAAGQITRR